MPSVPRRPRRHRPSDDIRHRPSRVTLVLLALALLCQACTPGSSPTPTGNTSTATTGSTGQSRPTGPSDQSGTTDQSAPETSIGPDVGTDHFVPFRSTVPGSAIGKRVGLIGLNQANPFSSLVTASIKEELAIAGADFVFCDSESKAEVALNCARRFATQGVNAYLTFQPVAAAGQSICAAGPKGAPVIAIDTTQGSCEAARMGVNDEYAGFTAGVELGRFAQRSKCGYDAFLLIADSTLGEAAVRRVDGLRRGFVSMCPGTPTGEKVIDAPSQDVAFTRVSEALTMLPEPTTAIGSGAAGAPGTAPALTTPAIPGPSNAATATSGTATTGTATPGTATPAAGRPTRRVLVAGINDEVVLGALAAARAAGRPDEMDAVGLGAATRARCEIATNPHWIGDTAFFPERYGEIAVPYLIDLLNGRDIPQRLFVRSVFINAANILDYYSVRNCKATS